MTCVIKASGPEVGLNVEHLVVPRLGTARLAISPCGEEVAGFLPETQALFDEMVVAPTGDLATAYNDFISDLITAGVWSKLGVLYVPASVSPLDARLNLKDPTSLTTKAGVGGTGSVHSPTDGWETSSSGNFYTLGTGLNFDALPGWDGSNLSMSHLSKGTLSNGNNVAWSDVAVNHALHIALAPSGGDRFRLRNLVSFDTGSPAVLDILISVMRLNSTTIAYSRDGSDPGAGAPVTTTTGADGSVIKLAWGAAPGAGHYVRLFAFGVALSAVEISDFNLAAKALMTAIDI